jgi:predicted Zn finger-like uncharacterized protein
VRIISCPACDEEIEVDSEAEGRKVRCPECDERFVVPRRTRQDEEDVPPRKKKKRRKSGPNWTVIGGIATGVLVLVVGGIIAYFVTRPKPDQVKTNDETPAPANAQAVIPGLPHTVGTPPRRQTLELPPPPPLPKGWVRFSANEINLSAYWPGKPEGPEESESDMGGRGVLKVENRKYGYQLPGEGGGYGLDVMILPAGKTSLNEEEKGPFLRLPRHQIERLAKGRVAAERSTTLGGAPATEFELTIGGITGVCRYGFVRAGSRLLFVMATAAGPKVSRADAQSFLDSIRPTE